jgi:hypothetical protein
MKRLFSFVIIALLAVGLGGTALAATSVELGSDGSGVSTVYWGASFSTAPSGASAYVATGGIALDATKDEGGTTLYAISNNLTNATGTELRAQRLVFISGATPIGPPQLLSGATDAVVYYVQASQEKTVGDSTTDSGTSLWVVDGGTGATNWELGISGLGQGTAVATTGLFDLAVAGTFPYSFAPVTIDDESAATAGATIYGIVSGLEVGNNKAGASIFAVNAATGNFATISGNAAISNATGLNLSVPTNSQYLSAVSAVHTAPVLSGATGLFIVGWNATRSGLSLLQFDKNNLYDGPSAVTDVGNYPNLTDQFIPTPAASGGSIFVVDNNGGVTAYAAINLEDQYAVDYAGNSFDGGVSGAPVTDGTYIVLCATSSLTGYQINNLSGNSKEWTYDFGSSSRYTIDSTPAISGGYVWVTVNDSQTGTATLWRLTLASTSNGAPLMVSNLPRTFASPIVVGNSIWSASYDPLVQKIVAGGAAGENNWPQFKFNKAKTGANTADEDDVVPGSGGGCFISTIK